jgi:O-antigen/teichoic acid export membrane protein
MKQTVETMSKRTFFPRVKFLLQAGFFHIFGSNAINQIVSFAYGILIVRVISKSEYGVFVYANNIYSMLILLSGFGIVSALLQLGSEHASDQVKSASYFAFSNRFGVCFNLGLSAIVLLVGLLIPLPIKGSNQLLLMMTLLPMLQIIRDLQIINLRVNLRNRAFSYANTTNVILTSIMTILGAWLFSTRGIVFSQYLVVILMILILAFKMKVPFFVKGDSLERQEKKDLLQIAGVSALNNALTQLLTLLGAFVLGLVVMDEDAIASYKVATTIPFALNFIPSSLMMFAYPYFARHKNDREWVRKYYCLITFSMCLLNVFVVAGGVLLAQPIITIVFGSVYLDAVKPFQILMVGYFLGTFQSIAGNLLVTQRKLKFNLLLGILGAVSGMVFNVVLIPQMLSIGTALSHVLTKVLLSIVSTVYFLKIVRKIPEK